jgi:septum formation protein
MPPLQLILASTSPYRRRLLARLRVAFSVMDPDIDETPLLGESAVQRASRLAQCKSEAPSATDTLIIGSDQVACLDGEILRKPGSVDNAIAQLMRCSNQTLVFWTAVSVRSTVTGLHKQRLVPSEVQMRSLTLPEVERYVAADNPLDCAGSFKWESLGITLFQRIKTEDPTALEGLPLIALCDLLRFHGLCLPLSAQLIEH